MLSTTLDGFTPSERPEPAEMTSAMSRLSASRIIPFLSALSTPQAHTEKSVPAASFLESPDDRMNFRSFGCVRSSRYILIHTIRITCLYGGRRTRPP